MFNYSMTFNSKLRTSCGNFKMRVLGLERNSLNIQKCLVPDCEFLRNNYGRCCVVTTNEHKFVVKIGLSEVKNIDETLFLDDSVLICSSFEKVKRTKRFNDITYKDFTVLNKITAAKFVQVVVVFFDFLNVKKFSASDDLKKVVKNILKLYLICSSCCVFLNCLPENQRFGVYCIIIKNVNDSENNVFKVNSNTVIKIEKCISQLKFEQWQEKDNQIRVGGCRKAYSILKETLDFSKAFNPCNIKFVNKLLLIGPAGCGKTTLINNVVIDCKCILLKILPTDINSMTPEKMEKKLNSIFEEAKIYAEQKECSVILIEDIDLMSSGRTVHAKRFVRQLINLLEEVDNVPGIVVVAITNNPDEVDYQLRRSKRLEDELEIMVPTADERVEILENILTHCCVVGVEKELLTIVSHWTPGFVGADLRLLVMEALLLYEKQDLKTSIDQQILKECFKQTLTKVIPSELRGTVGLCRTNNITFSQIGGLEEIKKILDLSVKQQLENPERFRKFGIPLTKGILLYGPPGCAKTTLVKALAKECNTTFLATSAADLYSPFVGDAEKKIVQLFTQARIGSPSILFIDEIDAVVGSKSGDRERGVQERILSTLLIEMDGVGLKVNTQKDSSLNILTGERKESNKEINSGVIVIGATNRPQLLDDALKRPGRFDRLLYVPPPDELERFRILKKLTEKMPLHESVNLSRIARLTNFYSGADLKNLCQETGLYALLSTDMTAECIHQSHFEYIIKEYKPSLNETVISFYESFKNFNI